MNIALQGMLDRYQPVTVRDYENALKEIVQELALLGLWRARFYEHAAFYGGSALRIFHQLPRFSEDIDFSLLQPGEKFVLEPYLQAIRAELTSFGFTFEVARKSKSTESRIESAFIKGATRINLLEIGTPDYLRERLPRTQKLKIKFELDTDPPPGAAYEVRSLLVPIPFDVRLFAPPDLFADKLHAILCREWKHRVKGRDFYDLVWYLGKNIHCHLSHLQSRMEQTGHWETGKELTAEALRELLRERVEAIDFEQAKHDVRPFIKDPDALALWKTGFFVKLVERVRTR